ncbi:MAG: VOC family protein [Flavobacteriales bacterium]
MSASSIIPGLIYDDARAAIDWLCNAFGFKKHLVVPGEDESIQHAELTLGKAMVMLGSSNSGSAYSKLTKSPQDLGVQTQSPYLIVDDPDAIYASAKRNGASMVIDIKEEAHGGRGFTCADPEGHLWSFGTYDPWQHAPQEK